MGEFDLFIVTFQVKDFIVNFFQNKAMLRLRWGTRVSNILYRLGIFVFRLAWSTKPLERLDNLCLASYKVE